MCVSLLLAVLGFGVGAALAQSAGGERPACARARGMTRAQAYGWNHIVVIENTCATAVTCRASTDVRPEPVVVRVAAGETAEQLMWLDSPASAFVARVDCEAAR